MNKIEHLLLFILTPLLQLRLPQPGAQMVGDDGTRFLSLFGENESDWGWRTMERMEFQRPSDLGTRIVQVFFANFYFRNFFSHL